jgi:LAS superfamily LD-carboxypeptidase LdcB/beta-lactamase class A
LGYTNYSGGRSYVAVKVAEVAAKPAETKPVATTPAKSEEKSSDTSSTQTTNTASTGETKVSYNGNYYSVQGKYGEVIIVNKQHPLNANYAPGENATAKQSFNNLKATMQSQGYAISDSYSGYRSYNHQSTLYNNYVAQHGQAQADRFSARPGYSEHQTGLAYDILSSDGSLVNDSKAVNWIKTNAHNYGFVVRYPEGKEAVTGFMYEPWHLRYIGKEATDIYNSGKTLEEYYGVKGGTTYGRANYTTTNTATPTPSTTNPKYNEVKVAEQIHTFVVDTAVKAEPTVASPALATYKAGQTVRYDSRVTNDGYEWLGYTNYSGGRSYVAVKRVDANAQTTNQAAKTPTTASTSLAKTYSGKNFQVLGNHNPTNTVMNALVNAINEVERQGYSVGFKMTDTKTGEGISYNANTKFYSASTIKAAYVAALAANRPATVTSERHNMKAVAEWSSNDGYAYLRNTYGAAPIYNWADKSGVSRTTIDPLYPYLTANELHALWETNYEYFNNSANGRQVGALFENPNLSPIKATVGQTTKTQSKAGWIAGWGYHAANDGGIVYTNKGDYVISVMSNADGKVGLLNNLVTALNNVHQALR